MAYEKSLVCAKMLNGIQKYSVVVLAKAHSKYGQTIPKKHTHTAQQEQNTRKCNL